MLMIGFQQLVQMHHHIFDLGIIHAALRGAAPGVDRLGIGTIDTDIIERIEVNDCLLYTSRCV